MKTKYQSNTIPDYNSFKHSSEEFTLKLKEATLLLMEKLSDVNLLTESEKYWTNLILEWANDESLPLYVRKFSHEFPRGSDVTHISGRKIIPCDNWPAHWSFSMCFNGNQIDLKDVSKLILEDRIPIAMILKAKERSSRYISTKLEIDNPNAKGWKIAHKIAVGLNSRKPIDQLDIKLLKEHFINFMNPGNMFLIPKKYSGFAEIEEVITTFNKAS